MDASTNVGPVHVNPTIQFPSLGGDDDDDSEEEEPEPTRARRNEELADETVEVGAGEAVALFFDVEEGDHVRGLVRETSGQRFDFSIMSEKNYAAFDNDDDYEVEEDEEDISTYTVDFIVPYSGVWYFVFDAYGKQNDREVDVTLRRS